MTADTPQTTAAALDRLRNALQLYASFAKGTVDDVLAKKGNDLRIQLFFGFSNARWKGGPGIAEIQMRERAAQGKGTRISDWVHKNPGTPPSGLNKQQALVWREVQARQEGIGVMAVSWLQKRWRHSSHSHLVANKTANNTAGYCEDDFGTVTVENVSREFGTLSKIEQKPGSIRLTGMTPGMVEVAERHGIVSEAMDRVTGDMMPYLERKMDALAKSVLGGAAA